MRTDYLKEAIQRALQNFEYNPEQDVYDLKEEQIDSGFIKKINANIKELKNQIKKVESLTEDEIKIIVEKKNNDSIEYVNKHNEQVIQLKEHLEELYKKVLEWDIKEDPNLSHFKTCVMNELLEFLNYKCVLMKPFDSIDVEKYKEETLNRLKQKLKQEQDVKKDYQTRIKETNKMTLLLQEHLPSLIKK